MPASTTRSKKRSSDKELVVPDRLKPESEKRERKSIERFTEVPVASRPTKPIVIKKGKGKKFEDCSQIIAQINKRTRNDEMLITLHELILGRVTKKVHVKDNLKNFSGMVYDEDNTKEKFEAKVSRLKVIEMKHLLRFFGLDPKGERDELEEKIIQFLEKPKDLEYSSPVKSTKRKRSESPAKKSKRSKKDPNAPKRPLSAFLLFSQEHRPDLQKEHPTESIGEISKRIGKMWSKIKPSEKKKFEEEAAKLKEAYEKKMAKYKKKKKSED